jgi:hypothetical protein
MAAIAALLGSDNVAPSGRRQKLVYWSNVGASAKAWHSNIKGRIVMMVLNITSNLEVVLSRAPTTRQTTSGSYDAESTGIIAIATSSSVNMTYMPLCYPIIENDIVYCQASGSQDYVGIFIELD